jgi:pimeloyl-ACP methyl ester carboxylesterase
MRRWLVVGGALLVYGIAWGILRARSLASSECFYVLLPPLYLILYLEFSPSGWHGLKIQLRPALFYVAGLAVFFIGYSYFMTGTILPATSGVLWSLRWFSPWEVAVGVYFLVAMSLILVSALALLRWLVGRADLWFFQNDPIKESNGRLRKFLLAALPPILLVPFVLPYVHAALFVYRFKVPNPYSTQELIQCDSEDVEFTTEDGLPIRGWFLAARSGRPSRTLIICHGLGANRSNFLPFVVVGDALEANALIFDFRGHGDSGGHTVTMGYWEKLDVLAAVKYLREKRPTQAREVFAIGISMGSAALIRAAAEVNPPLDGIIVDSSFPSAEELTNKVLAHYPSAIRPFIAGPGVPLACLHAGCWLPDVRPIDDVARVRAPLLMIHDQGEELMLLENAHRLFNQALEPKKMWVTKIGSHGSSLFGAREDYLQTVRDFYQCRATPSP